MKIVIIITLLAYSLSSLSLNTDQSIESFAYSISKELGYEINEKVMTRKVDQIAKKIRSDLRLGTKLRDSLSKHIYSKKYKSNILEFREEEGLLTNLLNGHEGNCFSYTALTIAVVKRLNIKISPIMIPGHIYLNYKDQNIETTVDGKNLSDKNIFQLLHLDPTKVKKILANDFEIKCFS